MDFCQEHWDMLRQNVIDEGIGDWIAPSGEIAVEQLKDELVKKEHTKTNYDPLMNCYWMIANKTLEMVGLYAMSEEFGCPICFFNTQRTEDGRCKCSDPNCQAKEVGTIAPFETWLKETPAVCRNYMIEQGWIDA